MSSLDSRTRPTRELRTPHARTTPAIQPQDQLVAQLGRITRDQANNFDRGFNAALAMVERGVSADELRAATGVVAHEWSASAPESGEFDEITIVESLST